MRDFGKGKMLNELQLKPHNVVLSYTTPMDYEMGRYMLIEDIEGLKYDEYLFLEGWHCSCYDFDETEWSGTVYDKKELLLLATTPYNENDKFWNMVKVYFG